MEFFMKYDVVDGRVLVEHLKLPAANEDNYYKITSERNLR